MNYNIENFYKSFPTIETHRNRFPFKKEINFNMKMGEITPICAIPVVPGQTYHLDMATVLKVAPLSTSPMDSATWKAFAFYQANRNTWDNYNYWFGEKKYPENPEKESTYMVPKIKMPETGCKFNGFFDNIGIPPQAKNYKIDAYMHRMDQQIWNTYFRNQNLENAIEVNTGDEDDEYTEEIDTLRKIARPRDLFAQCLKNQTGDTTVQIPLGTTAPVITGAKNSPTGTPGLEMTFRRTDGSELPTATNIFPLGINSRTTGDTFPHLIANTGGNTDSAGVFGIYPTNLIADLSKAMGAPLQGLYQAIAANTVEYIKSRGGTRYFELLTNLYNVTNPDQVLRLPEFLGSVQRTIDFDTITQTSQTAEQETGLGYRGANGYLEDYNQIISKSFGEFGWIIIYGVVTYHPKYQQGVSRLMNTEDPMDLFMPIFNRMGDEAIFLDEIYAQDPAVKQADGTPENDIVWGYGKRNSRLLYPINEVHGEQRSDYPQSLDKNIFSTFYDEAPKLNKDWDKLDGEGFKRALAVQEETQFIGNAMITGIQDIEIPLDAIPSPIPDQIM